MNSSSFLSFFFYILIPNWSLSSPSTLRHRVVICNLFWPCAAKKKNSPLRQKQKDGLRLMDFLFASSLLPVYSPAAILLSQNVPKLKFLPCLSGPPKAKYENSKLNGMFPLYICKSPEAETLYTGTWLRIPFLWKLGSYFCVKYCKTKKVREAWERCMCHGSFFVLDEFVPLINFSQGFKFCCFFCFIIYNILLSLCFYCAPCFVVVVFLIVLVMIFCLFIIKKMCYVTYFTCTNMSIFIIIVHMSLFFICVYIHK